MNDYPLQRLLNSCIEANDAFHAKHMASGIAKERNVRSYLADCRTIRLDIGIRTGKSNAIAELADYGDAIVCGTDTHLRSVFEPTLVKAKCFALLDMLHPVDTTFKRIWIDEPKLAFQYASPGLVYEMFGKTRDQLFILLG